MGFTIWLPLALWSAFAQTEVVTTEQAPYQAQVLSISAEGVELEVGSKLLMVEFDHLRRLNIAPGATSGKFEDRPNNAAAIATLNDGSQFGYGSFSLKDGTAHFEIAEGVLLKSLAMGVRRVQFQHLNDSQWTQWQAIVQSRAAADTLVLVRSKEALEKLEGIVLAVNGEQVSFDFNGQTIDAPLGKLAGLCFFASAAVSAQTNEAGLPKLAAIVRDRHGNRWMAATVAMPRGAEAVEILLQGGASLVLPMEQIVEIDFSSGSTQFLADLEPLAEEATTAELPLGLSVAGAAGLFGAQPRTVQPPGQVALGPSLEFLGCGTISYRIPPQFTRLRGEVELRPSGNRFTPCQATIKVENEILWQETLNETGRRWPIDLTIKPDGRLRIEVSSDAKTPLGDVVLWHELRLVK